MKSSIIYRASSERDHEAMVDFVYELRDDLQINDRAVAEQIVQLVANHGGAFIGTLNGRVISCMGYFFGDPANDFAQKDLCFIYVAGITEEYRCSRVFLDAYRFAMSELSQFEFREVRCQAGMDNPYTNRIYSRLFKLHGTTVNRRGIPVNQYRLPFTEAVERLAA